MRVISFDTFSTWVDEALKQIQSLNLTAEQHLIVLLNKDDLWNTTLLTEALQSRFDILSISARSGEGLDDLQRLLVDSVADNMDEDSLIVSNVRHYEALLHACEALDRAQQGLQNGLPSDLVSEEVRQVLYHLGSITGEITTDDILGNIFSKFCIGK